MARKLSNVIQYKIRVREDLRRRLEAAAKRRDVSINFEMTSRLKESFEHEEKLKLSKITSNLENFYERYAKETRVFLLQEDLIRAAELLIQSLPVEIREREAVKATVERAQEAIKLIAAAVGRIPEDD